MTDEVKKRLLETLNETVGQKTMRTSVLVLGEGVNIQAARLRGREAKDGWSHILRSLWAKAGGNPDNFDHLPSSALQWTCLVELHARSKGIKLSSAGKILQTTVCKRLKQVEEKRLESKTLYTEILNANFANIVWFNLDHRIVRHVPASRFKKLSGNSSFLYRRLRIKRDAGDKDDDYGTNIWFPYGDVSNPPSFQIGHAYYDHRLMELENYRDGMMNNWFDWNGNYSGYELQPPDEVYLKLWKHVESWYDLFFLAPLIFVGVSLSRDDWPIWWLLHQRARNVVPFEDHERPQTFYLTCKGADTAHLKGAPAGIELVEFDSYDSMWIFLRKALARKPK